MTQALIVTSSAQAGQSVSNRLAEAFERRLRRENRGIRIIRRDVGGEPVPHLTAETIGAIRGEAETDAEQRARRLSDEMIAELKAADIVIIAAPMYNFGMSSTLKAWFDHVVRARVTFRYTNEGSEGLLKGKKAVVIETRAGLYDQGPTAAMDHQEPHIRTLLGFIGIDDVTFVRAERLAFGPDAAEASIAAAEAEFDSIVREELPLAA